MDILFLYSLVFLISTFITLHLIPARKRCNLPPGPRPLPIIGNLLHLGNSPHQSMAKLAKSYGPIMSLKLGQVTAVVVSSPYTIQQVLQTHDHVLSSHRAIPDALTVYNHDQVGIPWIPISPTYKNIRRICNSYLLSPKTLDANKNLRRAKINDLVADVRVSAVNKEAVDIGAAVFATALNLVSYSIWSVDLGDSETVKRFKRTMRRLLEEGGRPNLSDFFPGLKKMDVQGVRRRIAVHFAEMFGFIDEMIDQRLMIMHESPELAPKTDLLHHLLNMREENCEVPLDRNQIKHTILVLFTASTDTTTSIVQWAMAHLLKNPKVMLKAKQELLQVIGKGNQIEESHIDKLPYLQAIIKETLRLQSAFLLPRKAESEVAISGYTIPKGTQIIVNTWASGRDSTVWKNPDWFVPDRFLGSTSDFKARNFDVVPFGGGRRSCPGQALAIRMLHLMVGSLVHCFDWKLVDGVTPQNLNMDEKFGITVERAHPLLAVPLLV